MFDRFTEKARRVIFFARYEASQYGSSVIDTEHLLLGLVREDKEFVWRFLDCGAAAVRTEVEKSITRGARIATSVEMPLSEDAKRILNLAMDESDRLGHRHVGTEHILVGMLLVEESMAARVLAAQGVNPRVVREELARPVGYEVKPRPSAAAQQVLDGFLAALRDLTGSEISQYFSPNAQVIDSKGHLWQGRMGQLAELVFAPYSKRDIQYVVESCERGVSDSLVSNVLWRNITVPGQSGRLIHRMTILMGQNQPGDWAIFFLQVTPVVIS